MKDMLKDYYKSLNVDERVFEYCNSVEEKLKDRFAKIDAVSEINQLKKSRTYAVYVCCRRSCKK